MRSLSNHKQACKAVIEAIRANPAITKQEAVAIVEAIFPGYGSQYLDWYVNTFYRFACTDNDTFASTRKRITALPIEQYEIAVNKLARLAADKAVSRASKKLLEAELGALEETTEPFVPKVEPDAETLALWNERSSHLMDYNMANARMIWLQEQIAALEEEEEV